MTTKNPCECRDPGCPCCHGSCTKAKRFTLVRVDMEDDTGTNMCAGCADDALESGLFRVGHWTIGVRNRRQRRAPR